MRRPRLLMVSTHGYVSAQPQLGKPDTGGQVVYVLELSKALARCGFDVDILTRQFENQSLCEEVNEKVRVIRIPYGGQKFRPKETLAGLVPDLVGALDDHSYLAEAEYDLLSSHYWDAGVAGVRLSKLWGIPHVHTPHSMGLLKRQNRAWGPTGDTEADHLNERITQERMIYHSCDLVVSTAGEQTRCLNESDEYNLPMERIEQIPPGFDATVFYRPLEGEKEFIKELTGWPRPTVFAAGRLAVSKGYDLLIRAFPAVVKRVFNAQLVLAIGPQNPDAEEAKFLQDLQALAVTLGVANHVHFMPCIEQARLADHYRAADVFVLCSRNEPFGMTALESMACGTPTVVTTRGGLWEELVWGQDCIYCDPIDSEALAQSISSPLLHGRIRAQLGENGAETARSLYTWGKIADRYLKACREHQCLRTSSDFDLTPIRN